MRSLARSFALLLLLISPGAHALTCVPSVIQWGTITYINLNQIACAANEWAVFTSADLSAYAASQSTGTTTTTGGVALADFQALQAQVAALQAGSPVVTTGGNVFDPATGAAFWSFAMTFILGVFLLAKNAAAILNAVKNL